MSLIKNFRMLALYNQRVNEQLIGVCAALPSDVLNTDTKSFFPTIIDYWNHILFGDLILLGRIAANEVAGLSKEDFSSFPTPKSPTDTYFRTMEDLAILRVKVDKLLVKYCKHLTESDIESVITYTTTEGEVMTKAVADITQHIFNHQAHHRGQLTCVLSQFGADYGCMDLPVIVAQGSRNL